MFIKTAVETQTVANGGAILNSLPLRIFYLLIFVLLTIQNRSWATRGGTRKSKLVTV